MNPGHWGRVRLVDGDAVFFRSEVDGRMKVEFRRSCYVIPSPEEIDARRRAIQAAWDPMTRASRAADARRHVWNISSIRRMRWCPICRQHVQPIELTAAEQRRGEVERCPVCRLSTRKATQRARKAMEQTQQVILEVARAEGVLMIPAVPREQHAPHGGERDMI